MSRFLLGWELGGGIGHTLRLASIARALRAAGQQAAVVLRDLRTATALDLALDIPVMQAPTCIHNYDGLSDPPLNYAEVLMRFGYLDADMLTSLVRGWRALAQSTAADVIIADHAPTAMLAAKTLGLRCVFIGNGFTVPPLVSPTPNMRSWLQISADRLAGSDKNVLDAINGVLAKFGAKPFAHLFELFDIDGIFIANFRELDHYANRPAADLARITYCGPFATPMQRMEKPQWPASPGTGTGKKIFAYLKPGYPHLAATLSALAASGEPCVIHGLGGSSAATPQNAANLAYASQPVDVPQAARECSLGICHAGTTTANLLQLGRPMLLLPTQLEQFLEGSRAAELGAGLVVNPEEKQPDIAGALTRLLNEPAFTTQAAKFAANYREWSADRIQQQVVGRLLDIANGNRLQPAGSAL